MPDRHRSCRVLEEPGPLGPAFGSAVGTGPEEHDPLQEAIEEGRERGYREGRARAEQELSRELEQVRCELAGALERLATLESELTRRLQARLLEIAVEAASRIARHRVDAGDPVATRALEEALATLPDATPVRARLHPDDLAAVEESLGAVIEAGRLELLADPGVGRGGTVVESESGQVDATIDAAEAAMRAAVAGVEVIG